MKKIFCLILVVMFFTAPIVHAEVKNYVGTGFFAVVNEKLDYAKNQAKLDGARNIAEQIFIDVQGVTEVKNSQLTHDEIILTTESLMKILDVKYKIEPVENDSFIIRAEQKNFS